MKEWEEKLIKLAENRVFQKEPRRRGGLLCTASR